MRDIGRERERREEDSLREEDRSGMLRKRTCGATLILVFGFFILKLIIKNRARIVNIRLMEK